MVGFREIIDKKLHKLFSDGPEIFKCLKEEILLSNSGGAESFFSFK